MIVALDSSTLTLSLAVGRPGEAQPLAAERVGPPARMSDLLPAALVDLLRRAGLGLDDVRGFAVGLGPGSFTGLRIGLATVKGLAYARRLGVAGASSLAALALEGPEDVPLGAIAVARLAGVPPAWNLDALSALEPHYVRASEAERNPKFPPLPGPAPAARIRDEED